MAKIPGTPIHLSSTGPITRARAKLSPMVAPIEAMALVRCSSRVRSASSAETTAETAPAPCITRPMMTPLIVLAGSRHEAAQGKQQQAEHDHPLAPDPVGNHAEGQLQQGLGQAIGAQAPGPP